MRQSGGNVPSVDTKRTKPVQKQSKGSASDPAMPSNWEPTPLQPTSLIEARSGNIRTYIVGRIQVGKARDETNGYLTFHIAMHTPWWCGAIPRGVHELM